MGGCAYLMVAEDAAAEDAVAVVKLAEGDGQAALDDEIKGAVNMVLLHCLFPVEDIAELYALIVLQAFKEGADLCLHLGIVGVCKLNIGCKTGGMDNSVKVLEAAVLIEANKAVFAEEDIEVDNFLNVGLTVVAEDDDIGLFKSTLAAESFKNGAEFLVMLEKLFLCHGVVYAVLVACAVKVAHLDEHDVGLLIVLKNVEGTVSMLFKLLKQGLLGSTKGKVAALLAKDTFKHLKGSFDSTEVGGAPLLGVEGAVIKAHGNSNARAIFCAIRQAKKVVDSGVVDQIREGVAQLADAEEKEEA